MAAQVEVVENGPHFVELVTTIDFRVVSKVQARLPNLHLFHHQSSLSRVVVNKFYCTTVAWDANRVILNQQCYLIFSETLL